MAAAPAAASLPPRARRPVPAASVPDAWDADDEPAEPQPAERPAPPRAAPATAGPPAAAPEPARDSQAWAAARPGGTWQQEERRLWHAANASAPAAAPIVTRVLPPLGAPSLSGSAPPPRILARPPRDTADSAPAPAAPAKSRAQREEEYAQARARIFGPDGGAATETRAAAGVRSRNSRRGDRRGKPPDPV